MGIVEVAGGVDTHADFHVAAAVDVNGGVLDVERFSASSEGYEALVAWLAELGRVTRVGVEGTGSYGVGLARFLIDADIEVVEVDRQNRQVRRKKGKSDPTDSVTAARAALSGSAAVVPNGNDLPANEPFAFSMNGTGWAMWEPPEFNNVGFAVNLVGIADDFAVFSDWEGQRLWIATPTE